MFRSAAPGFRASLGLFYVPMHIPAPKEGETGDEESCESSYSDCTLIPSHSHTAGVPLGTSSLPLKPPSKRRAVNSRHPHCRQKHPWGYKQVLLMKPLCLKWMSRGHPVSVGMECGTGFRIKNSAEAFPYTLHTPRHACFRSA